MHLAQDHYSAQDGPALALSIHRSPTEAGRVYRLLGSVSSTSPGTQLGGILVPLNTDGLFTYTLNMPAGAPFVGNLGILDSQGSAHAQLDLPSGRLNPFVGQTISFAALVRSPQGLTVTESRSVLIDP